MNTIVEYTEKNSTKIRDNKATCDRCNAQNLRKSYSILNMISFNGDCDYDTFEFERGIWSICGLCMMHYLKQNPKDYVVEHSNRTYSVMICTTMFNYATKKEAYDALSNKKIHECYGTVHHTYDAAGARYVCSICKRPV